MNAGGKKIAIMTDVRGALGEGIARLSAANVPSRTLAAELLLMHALGRDRTWLYAHPEAEVEPTALETYFALVARRASAVPTQYLTGQQDFWGLTFEVTPAVLIPRPETEHVVEVALERIGAERRTSPVRIADVGTGSGCIAVALARELPCAEIVATDISGQALEIAKRNAARHGVADRVKFIECNLLGGVNHSTRFDLIVGNPPYIPSREAAKLQREIREHEPAIALFAGDDGLVVYAPLTEQAAMNLVRGGALVLELGHDSLTGVRSMLDAAGVWKDIRVTNDLAGIPRVISAIYHNR